MITCTSAVSSFSKIGPKRTRQCLLQPLSRVPLENELNQGSAQSMD